MVKFEYLNTMAGKLDDEIEREFKGRLAELLAVPASRIRIQREAHTLAGRADRLVSAGERRFAVEWRASSTAAEVAMALRSVRTFVENSKSKLIPLFVAPYVGEVGHSFAPERRFPGWICPATPTCSPPACGLS